MVFKSLISNFKKSKVIKKKYYLYKGCSDISIYNFDIAYKTQDYRYLVVGFDGYEDIELPEGTDQKWTELFDEWVKLSDNNTIIYYYQLVSEVAYLETRYIVAEALLLQMYERDMSEKTLDMYINMLKEWKYIYNKENDKIDELTRLFNQHQASTNKLGIKRDELEKLRDINDGEDVQTLEAQAVVLEQVTGRNNIDTKKTSVTKWIEICKVAESINNQRRRQYGK